MGLLFGKGTTCQKIYFQWIKVGMSPDCPRRLSELCGLSRSISGNCPEVFFPADYIYIYFFFTSILHAHLFGNCPEVFFSGDYILFLPQYCMPTSSVLWGPIGCNCKSKYFRLGNLRLNWKNRHNTKTIGRNYNPILHPLLLRPHPPRVSLRSDGRTSPSDPTPPYHSPYPVGIGEMGEVGGYRPSG